jgi:hypothetical protein
VTWRLWPAMTWFSFFSSLTTCNINVKKRELREWGSNKWACALDGSRGEMTNGPADLVFLIAADQSRNI